MKKFKSILLLIIITFSCDSSSEIPLQFEKPELQELHEYLLSENAFDEKVPGLIIDYDNSSIEIINSVKIMHIVLRNEDNSMAGVIHGFKVGNEFRDNLPYLKDYALVYDSFHQVGYSQKSGIVKTYDWNYNSLVMEIQFKNNSVADYNRFSIQENPDRVKSEIDDDEFPDSCYGGSNNNVSWG